MKTLALLAGLSAALTSAYNLDTFPLEAAIDMPSFSVDDNDLNNIRVNWDMRCNALQAVVFQEARLFKGPKGIAQDLSGNQVGTTISNTFPFACDLRGQVVTFPPGIVSDALGVYACITYWITATESGAASTAPKTQCLLGPHAKAVAQTTPAYQQCVAACQRRRGSRLSDCIEECWYAI